MSEPTGGGGGQGEIAPPPTMIFDNKNIFKSILSLSL